MRQERGTKTQAGLTATWDKTPRPVYPLPKRAAVPNADGKATRLSYSICHMDDDSLKAVIRAEAGPLAVNPQDRSNGRVAWLVIQRECDEPSSALHINTKILEYNGLTIQKDVGVTKATGRSQTSTARL